jgi:hypothetical protein
MTGVGLAAQFPLLVDPFDRAPAPRAHSVARGLPRRRVHGHVEVALTPGGEPFNYKQPYNRVHRQQAKNHYDR